MHSSGTLARRLKAVSRISFSTSVLSLDSPTTLEKEVERDTMLEISSHLPRKISREGSGR